MAARKQRLWKRLDQYQHELPDNWQPSKPQAAVAKLAAPSWSPGGSTLLSQDERSMTAPPHDAEGQINVNIAAIRGTHPNKKGHKTNG
jgi:hypothetical protein